MLFGISEHPIQTKITRLIIMAPITHVVTFELKADTSDDEIKRVRLIMDVQ